MNMGDPYDVPHVHALEDALRASNEALRHNYFEADRYQTRRFPHNRERAPRRGNVRGHDMTEVTAMQTKSNDTDDRRGRIVGVEDDAGRAWCFECADAEIRQAGETAFMDDLFAGWAARRKCVKCRRRLGEVAG